MQKRSGVGYLRNFMIERVKFRQKLISEFPFFRRYSPLGGINRYARVSWRLLRARRHFLDPNAFFLLDPNAFFACFVRLGFAILTLYLRQLQHLAISS